MIASRAARRRYAGGMSWKAVGGVVPPVLVLVLVLVLAGACSGDGSRTVSGVGVLHYLTDQGEVAVPQDYSAATIEALVPDGAGGFTAIDGTGRADGTFAIPGVPSGPYYLRVPDPAGAVPAFLVTDASTVDLGGYVVGRPDAAGPASPTDQELQLDGPAPWHGGDLLEWYSSNASAYLFGMAAIATAGAPTPGATSADLTVRLDLPQRARLVQASRGDTVYVSQLSARASGTMPYQALIGAVRVDDAEEVEGLGASPPVAGTLTAPPDAAPLHVDWHRTEFRALFPAGASPGGSLGITAEPGAYAHEPANRGEPDLAIVVDNGAGGDVDLPDLTYGDPYPASWDRVIEVRYGTGTGVAPDAYYYDRRQLSSVAADPVVAPLIGPPTALAVDGDHVSWGPPALGAADRYWVRVSAVDATTHVALDVLYLTTTATSCDLPPEAFAGGGDFYVSVFAEAGAAGTIPAAGSAGASAVSGPLTR